MHCWWGCKLVPSVWRTVWRVPEKKLKVGFPRDPTVPLLGIDLKKMDSRDPRGRSQALADRGVVRSSQGVEATGVYQKGRTDEKNNEIRPNRGILFSLTKEGNPDTGYSVHESRGCCAQRNEPLTERQVLHDLTSLSFSELLRVIRVTETEMEQGCQGLGWGGHEGLLSKGD